MKCILGVYKMKWIPCCLSGAQELYRVKEEADSYRYYLHRYYVNTTPDEITLQV